MYVGDEGNNRVRKIKPSGIISTVAGTGTYSFSGDGGPATVATLRAPVGTVKDAGGNLYICDVSNNRVRKVTPTPHTLSGSSTVCVGATITLTGSESGGTWTSATPAIAVVGSASGVVTGTMSGTVVISYTESGITATRTITVNPLPSAIAGTTTVCVGAVTTLTSSPGGTWGTSSSAIASVDMMGNVTGVSAGTANITYGLLTTMCYVTTAVTVNPCTLSTADIDPKAQEVKLFPNPNTGSFTMELPASTSMILVTDYLGRVVATESIAMPQAHTLSLKLEALPPGNYLVKVYTASGAYRNKLVIVK